MRGEGEIHAPRHFDDAVAMDCQPLVIGLAQILRASHHEAQLFLDPLEFGAARKGQIFLRRVEHLDHVAANAVCGIGFHARDDFIGGRKEIADEDHLRKAGYALGRRQTCHACLVRALLRLVDQGMGHAAERRPAGRRREAVSERGHAFPALHQQRGQGERENGGAVLLAAGREVGGIIHRGRAVAPDPDALRRLALRLAHEEMGGARRMPPVDR